MRRITEHRLDEGGFNESVQSLVRNTPWWMTSAIAHAIVLLVLANVPYIIKRSESATTMATEFVEPPKDLDEEPFIEPPPPDIPIEQIVEDPIETIDDVVQDVSEEDQDYSDDESDETSEAPFTGPSMNTAIGLTGGAGGPRGGPRRRRRANLDQRSGRTETAVERGLKWLADHQDIDGDGRWDCDDFMKHDRADDRCTGPGGALYDVGVTGLALLAFYGANYTERSKHPFARHVREGTHFLIGSQDEEGCFGVRSSKHFMYNHAIATLAVCEAWWMTRNPRYRKPAQDGLSFIARSRNPYLAWRYEPRGGENDTSVTGWMVMALKSGAFGGLEIDPDAFDGARRWIDKMTDPDYGQVGYNMPGGGSARPEGLQDRWPPEKTQSMTAVGMLTRIFLGEDPSSEMIRKGAELCLENLPVWNPDDGSIDMYYWYYATLAMFQVGGTPWKKWNQAMKEAIVKHQHPANSGSKTGSWDPIGPWGADGGRVYSTACMVMCLEVYYRYDRVTGIGYNK